MKPFYLPAVLVSLTLAIVAPHVPCDAQWKYMGEARAADVATVPDEADKEHSVVTPFLRFEPPDAPPGTPVQLVFGPPVSDRVVLKWGEQKFGKKLAEANRWDVWPVPGENLATVQVRWTTADSIEVIDLTAKHTSGAPPPPVPLAELAGVDAKALGGVYATLAQADDYADLADFHGTELVALRANKLTENAAVRTIAVRLAKIYPFDVKVLVAEVAAIAKELGAEPVVVDPNNPPVDPNSPVTAATYVYEKDDTAVPTGVVTGINRLNRERNIIATLFEEDTRDGDGDVPDQYAVALAAATQAGLPAFIVQAGDKVLLVVKAPVTEAQVLEAVR